MEWKEAIPERMVSLTIEIIKRARVPVDRPSMMKANADKFYEAWEEGHPAQHGGEPKWAHYYYHQALAAAPEDIDTETLAEILEGLNYAERFLAQDEQALPALRAAIDQDPNNSDKRFRCANALWRLGREEEAARE